MIINWKVNATILIALLFIPNIKVHGASTNSGCLNSSATTWTNTSFPPETAQFSATYDATPHQNGMDGVTGFSLNAARGYTSLAAITRFASTGRIDVRNAGVYSADVAVPYTAGLTYHFRLLISPTTKRYTVYVTPPGGKELTLATSYAFRSEQSSVSTLNNWSMYAHIGSQSVCNMTVSSGSTVKPPTISTQPASQTITAGKTATFTVAAEGTAPLTYQWQKNGANIAGATAGSYTTPVTTTANSGSTFTVVVSNTAGTLRSSAATLTVNGAPAGGIQLSSSSLTFGDDVVGSTSTQVLIITNTGTATLIIPQLTESGSAFSLSGFSLPLNLTAGQQSIVKVAFQPTAVGTVSGHVSIVSNALTSPNSVDLTGTGMAATRSLSISPASLSFGNVRTGTSSATQKVDITNTGNSSVTISQMTLSGSAYSMTGGSTPVTLSPSQNLILALQFSPKVVSTMNGSISMVSNATGSPAKVTLSGTGVSAVQHSVALTWNASTSTVSGYNVYRSTASAGPFTKINSSLLGALNYSDSTVQSGTTYHYVTTAVDASNNESVYSDEVSATIP